MQETAHFFEKIIAAQQALLRDDEHSLRDTLAAFGDAVRADWAFLYKAEPIARDTQVLNPVAAWHGQTPVSVSAVPDIQPESVARLRKGETLRGLEVNAVAYTADGIDAVNQGETLVMPVRYKEEFLGALWVSCALTANDIERLKPFLDALGLYKKRKRVERLLWEHQTELVTLREAALSASKAKSEFLASMSHEIRTPMNAILGATDLLIETSLSGEQRHYVSLLRNAGSALLALIDDILDFSKVEAGQLRLEKIDFDVRDLVERIIDMMSIRANEKKLTIHYSVAPDVPAFLVGDPNRLRQILVNLIGNAIKFTPAGSITVSVQKDAALAHGLRFSVADTGIGVPKEKQAEIFEQFAQADSSNTRRFGGVGLGLAISKRLVELMNGKIWVESEPQQGSTFSFTAQFEPSMATDAVLSAQSVLLEGRTALIIDNDEQQREALAQLFREWSAASIEMVSIDAGKIQQRLNEREPVNIIALNCRMSEEESEKIVAAIQLHQQRNKTIIIVFNARRQSDFKRLEQLAVAAYLVEPVRRNEVAKALQRALMEERLQSAIVKPDEQKRLAILLAEDSLDNQLLVKAYLKKMPHELDIAETGVSAVEKFKHGAYDIVLMDMQMPEMDGYMATETIRRFEKTSGKTPTPIIALTAHALREEEQKAYDAGCNAYLTKPVKREDLIATIQHFSKSARLKNHVG